ncbi:MAG TPA: DUF892 family protein [Solirubrobacteraceae bacterium]|jgi:ferritin-like metal-binding protein YciE|nr:DUF892 family protein [Solirubrobacteraceae bacterium]
MSRRGKVLQYLEEAHAAEVALARALRSQIAITPEGRYRHLLESHLRATRDHADRLERRMNELGHGQAPLKALVGAAESAAGQLLSIGRTPLDLLRGTGGEERVLSGAKDTAAIEALEIATYTAIERLARNVHDEETARLASSLAAEEQKMLDRVLREIPRLTDAVAAAEAGGSGSDVLAGRGAVDVKRRNGAAAEQAAGPTEPRPSRTARTSRKTRGAPGVARAGRRVTGSALAAGDLPIADYEKLTASEIAARLPELAQVDLAKVEAYERGHQKRSRVQNRITALRAREPWPGYDELTAGEIRAALENAGERLAQRVYDFELAHKNRSGVLEAAARERTHA